MLSPHPRQVAAADAALRARSLVAVWVMLLVVVSDGRKINAEGRCTTPVGNTVNVEKATWTNTIGDPELITVWTDPDFKADQSAFYYARVIEIPTPRWTAFDAKKFGIKMGDEVPMTFTERAYTSPIWYNP